MERGQREKVLLVLGLVLLGLFGVLVFCWSATCVRRTKGIPVARDQKGGEGLPGACSGYERCCMCPEGMLQFGYSCWYLELARLNYSTAKEKCEQKGMHLWQPGSRRSYGEMTWMWLVGGGNRCLWVGLESKSGVFWQDGTPYEREFGTVSERKDTRGGYLRRKWVRLGDPGQRCWSLCKFDCCSDGLSAPYLGRRRGWGTCALRDKTEVIMGGAEGYVRRG